MSSPSPQEIEFRVKRRRATFVLLGIVGVAGLLAGLYMLTLGRSPLAGQTSHDFGFVPIPNENEAGQATHTFELTNRTRSPITISDVRSTCGCATPTLNTDIVEPGETLEVATTLSLHSIGRRAASVYLKMEGRGTRQLNVEGFGRPVQQLRATRAALPLTQGSTRPIGLTAEVWNDDWDNTENVPEPRIDAPADMDAALATWTLRRTGGSGETAHAVWGGRIDVTLHEDAPPLADDAAIIVSLELNDEHELRIPLK